MMQTYRVSAFNTAQESENKIHDDDVARRFGFTGGLVPGVDVYAYMTQRVGGGPGWSGARRSAGLTGRSMTASLPM